MTNAQSPKVVFFGDSLTAGLGLSDAEAYPALVQELAQAEGISISIVNAGVSGDTTAGGVRRVDWAIQKGCDFFILALGANDGLRGLSADAMEDNLKAIIAQVKQKAPNCKIVLAGMYALPNMGPEYSEQFKRVFSDLSESQNLPLIPFLLEGVAREAKYNQPDGLHPNLEGQKIMAGNVWRVLKPLL